MIQFCKFNLATLSYFVIATFALLLPTRASAQGQASAPAQPAERGAQIFKMRCKICHDLYTTGGKMFIAPKLDGLFKREDLMVGKPVTEENVAEVIKTGPTPGMPAFRYTLSDDEIKAVVAYLKTK